jgi:hypothetical protein
MAPWTKGDGGGVEYSRKNDADSPWHLCLGTASQTQTRIARFPKRRALQGSTWAMKMDGLQTQDPGFLTSSYGCDRATANRRH